MLPNRAHLFWGLSNHKLVADVSRLGDYNITSYPNGKKASPLPLTSRLAIFIA